LTFLTDKPGVRLLIVPEDGRQTLSVHLTRGRLRLVVGLGVGLVAGVALLAGTWWYMAARASQVPALESEVAQLRESQDQVAGLAAQLAELEARYRQIRSLFGIDTAQVIPEIWRAPAVGSRPSTEDPEEALPTSWPLTQAGFVTQSLLDGGEGDHPGLDIAVPSHSYIRAAGAGTVSDTGEDPVYGKFVTVDHRDGYLTLYAHASEILVETGQRVRRNEVIALTGSTGRSTAPHLHFEIRLNGDTVDPMTMVQPPT
jgi:murein DD-endopeptidase MepM/ murein hydrolase activator NlpD